MPYDLHQRADTLSEDEQVAAVRVMVELLLHYERQPLHALSHVGVTHRDPHPGARWDHRSAFNAAAASASDAEAKILMRPPAGRSNSVATAWADACSAGSLTTTAGTNTCAAWQSAARRH